MEAACSACNVSIKCRYIVKHSMLCVPGQYKRVDNLSHLLFVAQVKPQIKELTKVYNQFGTVLLSSHLFLCSSSILTP